MVATACVALLAVLAACGGDTTGDQAGSRTGDSAGTAAPSPSNGRAGTAGTAGTSGTSGTSGDASSGSPVWGFTRFKAPSPPLGVPQAAPADGTAGSWRSGSGSAGSGSGSADSQVMIVRTQTGRYRVTFPGIAVPGKDGVALATSLGATTDSSVTSCHVTDWGPAGRDEQVDLACRNVAGEPVDSWFTAMFSYAPSAFRPAANSGTYAYLRHDAASAPESKPTDAYSVAGPGTIDVQRVGAGHYTIDLIGPQFTKNGNNLQVNAVGDTPVGCNALGRVVKSDRQSVFVGCAIGQTSTDSPFTLLYTSGHALIPTDATSFGHAFTGITGNGGPIQQVPAGPPADAWGWYSANSTGATNQIRRIGVGAYEVIFPGVARTPDSVQVTPYGEPTARCAVGAVSSAPAAGTGAPASVTVHCVDATGRPADSYVSVAYVSAGAPTP